MNEIEQQIMDKSVRYLDNVILIHRSDISKSFGLGAGTLYPYLDRPEFNRFKKGNYWKNLNSEFYELLFEVLKKKTSRFSIYNMLVTDMNSNKLSMELNKLINTDKKLYTREDLIEILEKCQSLN